jgi:hypothetical protein
MQLDLFEQLEREEREARQQAYMDEVKKQAAAAELYTDVISLADFERIKAERAISIDPDELPWRRILQSEFEKCNVLSIVPPNAISSLQYSLRKGSIGRDPVKTHLHEIWSEYNWCIWDYEPHGVDWCGAFSLLDRSRDMGEPVWMQLTRVNGKVRFWPECIVDYE